MASRSLTLTLPIHIFAWVSDMAVLHNYGSVHKSIRDLLGWAASAQPDDLDWIFGTKHAVHVPKIDKKRLHGQCRALGVTLSNSVAIEARLSDNLRRWISTCIDHYKLDGPSQVFDTVCRCAIELEAGDDIFESAESGRDLATCTADLYHDLGISGFSSSPPRRSRQSGQSR